MCDVIEVPDLGDVIVGIVSDGAGSAPQSEIGSNLATRTLAGTIARYYAEGQTLKRSGIQALPTWIEEVREAIGSFAATVDGSMRDFACTLLAAVVEPECAAFIQIGDGAIVVSPCDGLDEYSWVYWPQRGEYANLTHFITDADAAEQIQLDVVNSRIDELAIFSDGLQPLALNYAAQTVHEPFFRSLFGPVRSTLPGQSDQLSSSLTAFLGSDRVNARTDDDKAIVLASRRLSRSPQVAPVVCASPTELTS